MIRSAASKTMWVHKRTGTLSFFVLALLVVVLIGVLLAPTPAHAATFTVNSTADTGDASPDGACNTCTLREAIQEANANGVADTINFHSALSGTLTLTLGKLTIANDTPATDDLIIQGPAASTITVSGNAASRVFSINQNAHATISGLTISDGRVTGSAQGGGIFNQGTLRLTNSTVSGNTSEYDGGGIFNQGTLRLTNSTVSGNTANGTGGGIHNNGNGTLRLTNSTVSGNTAWSSLGGGGIDNNGTLRLTNSTVSGNRAEYVGGGIYNDGSTLELTNSTVSGNTAEYNGGIYNDGGTLELTNTIVARNTAFTSPDAYGTFDSEGNNLIGNTTGSSGWKTSDWLNRDPLLGPLQDNGGPTRTHALLPGSPAVDAANNTACLLTDQRGVTRIDGDKNGSVICDIGAFERNDLTPPKVTTTTPTGKKAPPEANVTATFSEVMDETSVEALGTFTLKKKGTTTTVPATVTYDPAARKATLDPTNKLRSGATYIATVTTAAKDTAGNALDQNSTTAGDQPKSWRFTVR